jgi:DNA-binding transcriptional LysR family regulator
VRFDLIDLQLFLHVFDAGSLTGGAARAHLTLASASERIRAMEVRFGAPLFERHSRGVRATPAGGALVAHARDVIQACERLDAALAPHRAAPVRLWANAAACGEHLPGLLEAFLARHPGEAIDLVEAPSDGIADALRAGRCDLGIVADWADLQGLDGVPFREDRLVLVVPPGDTLEGHAGVALAGLADRAFVALPANSVLQQHVEARAREAGVVLAVRVRAPGFDAACRMAAAGVGVAIVPEAAARRAGAIQVPLAHPWAVRSLTLCSRPGGVSPPVVRLMRHMQGSWP